MGKLNRQKGFSLIELMIVVMLLGIITFVVIRNPSQSIQVDSQAARLVADLRHVQHIAMAKNSRTRVNFSANQYTLTELDGSTAINHPSLSNNVITMPSGITISTDLPNNYVVFDGVGAPYVDNGDPGTTLTSTATITFTSGSDVENVTITPETGRVNKL